MDRLDDAILGSSILSVVEDFSLTFFSADEGDLPGTNIRKQRSSYIVYELKMIMAEMQGIVVCQRSPGC